MNLSVKAIAQGSKLSSDSSKIGLCDDVPGQVTQTNKTLTVEVNRTCETINRMR